MYAQLLGFPAAPGLPRVVSEEGPAALRRLGLVDALGRLLEVNDPEDRAVERPEPGDGVDRHPGQVVAAARRQARLFADAYTADCLPITVGGDHTTSLGTALALSQLGLSFDVVWVGARGDFITPLTSPSGHPHGMVLALLAGLTPYLPQTVPPGRLHLWGVRDPGHRERSLLEALGVDVRGVAASRPEWPSLLAGLGPNVLLSFDCDCCQPDAAPGTLAPVANGFERAEALRLVEHIFESRRVLALDVIELRPDRDQQGRTARLARDVILTAALARSRAAAPGPERPSPAAYLSPAESRFLPSPEVVHG